MCAVLVHKAAVLTLVMLQAGAGSQTDRQAVCDTHVGTGVMLLHRRVHTDAQADCRMQGSQSLRQQPLKQASTHQLADDLQLNRSLVPELVAGSNKACMSQQLCCVAHTHNRVLQRQPGIWCSRQRAHITDSDTAASGTLPYAYCPSPCGTPAAYAAARSASAWSLPGWYMGCHSAAGDTEQTQRQGWLGSLCVHGLP